ncbi:unnamed protein product, partial [Mesorhabditis belari]|uniref:TIL domain-containing protein n=1 Tax=Mesorhabditis belari TaxID=2138241 RepID=A0AAF3EE87_9BILA
MFKLIVFIILLFCTMVLSKPEKCPEHEVLQWHQGCDSCMARMPKDPAMGGFGCATAPQKGCFCPENFGRLEDNTCVHISKCPKNPGTR